MSAGLRLDLMADPAVAAQVRAAVLEAPQQPAFIAALVADPEFARALKAALAPDQLWLTHAETMTFLRLKKSAYFEWIKLHRGKLAISHKLGRKEPRIRLSTVLALLEEGAVFAPVPSPAPAEVRAPAQTPAPDRRSRLPQAALRDVRLAAR